MTRTNVWTFFYGSFMDLNVLKQADVVPQRFEVARLSGFDIQIRPLANLVRSDRHVVYGIVAATSHQELGHLYSQEWVSSYLPEAVLVETLGGEWRAALCYVSSSLEAEAAAEGYVERIVEAAKKHEFPDWYVDHLEGLGAEGHSG